MPLDVGLAAHNVVRSDGQGRVMVELARALVEAGHRVSVYTHRLEEELMPLVRLHHLARVPGPQLLDDLVLVATASRALRAADHDVTVVMGTCAVPRSPFVYEAHFSQRGWRRTWVRSNRPGLYHRAHSRITELLERALVQRAALVVACAPAVGHDVAAGPSPPVVVVPNGIDLDELSPVARETKEEARAGLRVPTDVFVVAFLGEYSTNRKGLTPLLRAISVGPCDEHLVVAGQGPRRALERQVDDLGVRDRVHLAGFVPAPMVYACADVVAVPSYYEPFSMVALEAAASGLPVIVSSGVGAGPLLGGGALTVSHPPQPAELRTAIDRVRAAPDMAAAMGAAGRRAAEGLTWDVIGPVAVAAVEKAASEGRVRRD